ncbi:MAG: AbrB/MazE/SpoVT family DNA-binding domain-containing protein [Anaerolineaceae bacterium]|nr:AbrB/MazE/SpoVT family DNA-binding domain-containing protein [Anaerolineaceae bacterium]
MTLQTKIIKIGNSQGIRIPKALLEQMKARGEVTLRIENGELIVSPVENPRQGWEKAFARMSVAGEDRLLIPDTIENDWDEEEWEW